MSANKNAIHTRNGGEEEDLFDFVELAGVLLHRFWALLISLLIGAAAAGFFTAQFITPKYTSTSMIYIYSKTTSITSLADLQIGSQLAVDFQIVATTREVVEKVIEDLGLQISYEDALKQISISNPSGSHILKIQATSTSAVQAANISNALAEELRGRIAAVMNTDEPSVVERAVVPAKPSDPSVMKNAVLGGAASAVLTAIVMITQFLMDDTIKTDQDIRKFLGINTLAAIPVERGIKSTQSPAEKRKKNAAR